MADADIGQQVWELIMVGNLGIRLEVLSVLQEYLVLLVLVINSDGQPNSYKPRTSPRLITTTRSCMRISAIILSSYMLSYSISIKSKSHHPCKL